MIEEIKKKVYWKTLLQFHISALFNHVLTGGREDEIDYLFYGGVVLVFCTCDGVEVAYHGIASISDVFLVWIDSVQLKEFDAAATHNPLDIKAE